MTLIDRARHLLTCDELRGRVPDEVTEFLRDVVALEPEMYVGDGHYLPRPLYTLDCVADTGCKVTTEKRHDR